MSAQRSLAEGSPFVLRQPPECIDLLPVLHFRAVETFLQERDGAIIRVPVDRKGVTVFAAVGKAEAGRVLEARRRVVDDLGNQGKSGQGPGSGLYRCRHETRGGPGRSCRGAWRPHRRV